MATKFAYPSGEFLSFNRPTTHKYAQLDPWGQGSSLPYDLITSGNFIALQNRSIDKVAQVDSSCYISVSTSPKETYCMHALPNAQHQPPLTQNPNTTPYWLMQLPQVFVPDHGTVFQSSFLELLNRAAQGTNYRLTLGSASLHKMQIQ